MERLHKFLSRAGVASRRAAEQLIIDGKVKVNGQVITTLGTQVDGNKDLVVVSGQPVTASSQRKYFLFYKPPGVVTTLADPQGRPTVTDYTKAIGSRVFPVGRLDFDAEGALLLTDDGELANKLMHPSHQVPRVYLAKVKGEPDEASLNKLVEGVRLEDGMAHATEARRFEKAERNTWLKLVVTEGRQHLVKRLCAAIGHPVVRLFRPAHASLSVQGLKPGDVRELSNDEIARIKRLAEGEPQPEPELRLPARRHGHAAPGFEEPGDEPVRRAPRPAPRLDPRKPAFGARAAADGKPTFVDRKRSEADTAGERRPGARKPVFGDRYPGGDRTFTSRKPAEEGGGASDRKSFGDRRSTGGDRKRFSAGRAADRKPAFGDRKPAFGDRKPAFGDRKPAFGDRKPAFGDRKPSFGDRKPSFGDRKPAFGDRKPAFGDRKPAFGDRKPAFGDRKPAFGERKPAFGDRKPAFGDRKPFGRKAYGDPPGERRTEGKPFGERKSYGGEDGERKSFGDRKAFGGPRPEGRSTPSKRAIPGRTFDKPRGGRPGGGSEGRGGPRSGGPRRTSRGGKPRSS